jgi:hypothetical protein
MILLPSGNNENDGLSHGLRGHMWLEGISVTYSCIVARCYKRYVRRNRSPANCYRLVLARLFSFIDDGFGNLICCVLTVTNRTFLTKFVTLSILIPGLLMCCIPRLACAANEPLERLIADFKAIVQEKDYQRSVSGLDEITKMGERLGITFAPAYYLKALRETTHGNGQLYSPLFKAIDSGVTASAFLLPELKDISSISNEQKQHYVTSSFELLHGRTPSGNWITPLMMVGLIKQRFGESRSAEASFHWYSRIALEGSSPVVNAVVLANKKNSDIENRLLCARTALSGSMARHPICSVFSQTTADVQEVLQSGVRAYKQQIKANYGAKFETIKSLVCGELKPEFAAGLVCYDALASIDEICFIRTKNKDYPELETLFVCDQTDVRWSNNILATILNDSLTWSIEK